MNRAAVHDDLHPHVRPLARRAVLITAGTLFAVGTLGSNLGPAWIDERPVVTLALSSRNRNLFASVPFLDGNWPVYAIVGFLRIMAAAVILFFLGRWYGRRAIEWTEGQLGELPAIYRWFQTAVDRAGPLMVIAMPGSNFVCLMAGHRRMAPVRFIAFAAIGTVIKLAVLWAGGTVFADSIRSALNAIEDYQWWIVAGLFALSFIQSAGKVRRDAPEVLHELEHPTDEGTEQPASDPEHGIEAHRHTGQA